MPEKPNQQQKPDEKVPLCSFCSMFGRQSPAVEELGGRPCCAYHFEREIAYTGQ